MTKIFCIAYLLLLYSMANPMIMQPVQAEAKLMPISIAHEGEPECSDADEDGECDTQPTRD